MTSLPAGPRSPGVIQALSWVWRPGPWLEHCRARYGDCFTIRLPGFGDAGLKPVVLISDPGLVKEVFSGGARFAQVNASRRALAPVFGERSVIVIDGHDHLRRRRMMLPPFHGERLDGYRDLIEAITERQLASWPTGERLSLQARFQAITLEIILRVVFGLEEGDRHREIHEAITRLLDLVGNPFSELAIGLPERLGPIDMRASLRRVKEPLDRLLSDEIARRRQVPDLTEREDILSLLLQARDEDGGGLGDQEIHDDLISLLLAGHETTATALTWTFLHLFQRPDALAAIVAECRTNTSTEYLQAVIKEVLRLRPPLPITDRVLAEPWRVNGHELPAGTVVAPCIYLLHRRGDLYPEPASFRPERFLQGGAETYSWIPFGGGMRRCLGASFATFEMEVVLKTTLTRVRLKAAQRRPERVRRRSIVLAPSRGGQVLVETVTPMDVGGSPPLRPMLRPPQPGGDDEDS
jgi:cytochrome P450